MLSMSSRTSIFLGVVFLCELNVQVRVHLLRTFNTERTMVRESLPV